MSAPPLLDVDRLLRTLAEFGVDFVVVGGVAGVVHGHERTTFDLDICYGRSPQSTRPGARARCARGFHQRGRQADTGPNGFPHLSAWTRSSSVPTLVTWTAW